MTGIETEVLKPILLRSSTPAPNEKVLKYLETLQPGDPAPEEWDDDDPAHAHRAWSQTRSPPSRARPIHQPSPKMSRDSTQQHLQNLAGSTVSYGAVHKPEHDDDVDSNEQDGVNSQLGSLPKREPGPEDPPGPRYESFDSGPSFGNKGPLPDADIHGRLNFSNWQPNWQNGAQPRAQYQTDWQGPQNDGLPASSIGFNIVNPSTPPRSQPEQLSMSASKAAASDVHSSHGVPTPPTSPKRTGGKVPTPPEPERAFSPVRSQKSHATGRTRGTEYPPLPASAYESSHRSGGDVPASPIEKAASITRAPSVSPSDSQSQVHLKRAAKSPTAQQVWPESSPRAPSRQMANGASAYGAKSPPLMSPTHQHRPFSPYRHAHTEEDLLHAALRGQTAMAQAMSSDGQKPNSHPHSRADGGESRAGSVASSKRSQPRSHAHSRAHDQEREGEGDATPTPSRPHTPEGVGELDAEEEQIVQETLGRTPRSSYAASALGSDILKSHFHDAELCALLHEAEDPKAHEVVRKAVKKAARQRIKRLGMKHDNESIKQYKRVFHNHDPAVHSEPGFQPHISEEAPEWAKELMETMARMQQRLDNLAPKIERLPSKGNLAYDGDTRYRKEYRPEEDEDGDWNTPMTRTVNINTQPTGTAVESTFQHPGTELVDDRQEVLDYDIEDDDDPNREFPTTVDGETRTREPVSDYINDGRDDSPGQQFLEEELYKLRVKKGSQSARTHATWEVTRDDDASYDGEEREEGPESGLPEIPDTNTRPTSPPLPPIPPDAQRDLVPAEEGNALWHAGQYSNEQDAIAPWQRIHQRLLNWAIIWPMSELDRALNSTTRGHQVDEIALSIWCTQCFKRYVRARLTENPPQRVDRLVVPPNMADAISTAVFNGRHGDASGMLRDLWAPFGLEGMPRLLVVLAKHRSEDHHWVVHRYSLPDGALSTYDTYPEKTIADGRPLGWWFAIRVAWPSPSYPSPTNLMQKIVRLHRPMQLGIDNSVAAAGIWRNVLMGGRAERPVDLERLRDLINQEVRNLRQRKQLGKLSVGPARQNWDDFN